MNKRHTEYIALYLFVFEAILLFGVMAVAFFATVIVLSALYISLQMTLDELLLPQMEKFLMRFPAFQKLEVCENIAAVSDTPTTVVETTEGIEVVET